MNSMFKHLIMYRIYFIATWTGLGYIVGGFLWIFYAYVVVCIIRVYCNPATTGWAITRLSVFWYLNNAHPITSTSFNSRMMQHNIFCAYQMCILSINLYRILSISPYGPRYVVEYVFVYLKLIVVCYLCCYTSIASCRVVTIALQIFEKWER